MVTILMTAAHAGYDSERVPLGGGAAICERLCRTWQGRPLVLLGSGPQAPAGVAYRQFDLLGGRHPATLNELSYAGFCRRFENACTEAILEHAGREPVVVLSHDLSEGPDFARLAAAGVASHCILHVDVVDFFCRMYLRQWIRPETAVRFHRRTRRWPIWPDLLRLVFDKQLDAAESCRSLVVPSDGMRGVLERCYGEGRLDVVPWGSQPVPAGVEAERERLRREWAVQGPLLVTLSRISPEKGQDTLLEELGRAEREGAIHGPLTLAIIGSAAYMGGARFLARLKRLAARLERVRVLFPGHLGGAVKHGALALADLMIVPSRHESYGLTTMEALANGLPVVALASHGTRATLRAGGGVLVERREELWPAIEGLLEAPERRRALAAQGLAQAGEETFERAAEQLYGLVTRSRPRAEPDRAR